MQTLKKLWRNEYFQTAITIASIFIVVFGLYLGAQAALGTEYPALAVASGSMLPTLNIGDLIIVQKIDPAQIHADPHGLNGDILVYKRKDELIVHRAVNIRCDENGVYWITTRGDNSLTNDEPWNSTQLIGKVIARIPFIGNLPLLLHSERNIYILFLALVIILIILMLPFGSQSEHPTSEEELHTKVGFNLTFYIITNIILVGLIIFSLWGSLTFWQPGAGASGDWVTIYGMFSDMQFHKHFGNKVYLYQNLLTYTINYEVDNGTRMGVPAFSWFQFFLLILILFNAWKLYNFLKLRKIGKTRREASV